MSIQNRPRCINNRVISIIAICQHGIKRGDRALPASPVPERSISDGIKETTEGGYPFEVGCSPSARPISRRAWATRVKLSIINRTFLPLSRKYSAIAVTVSCPYPQQGRTVSRFSHDNGSGSCFCTKDIFDKIANFATALAYQANHHHIGFGSVSSCSAAPIYPHQSQR